MKCAVLIVGAGSGERFGGDIPKQYQCINGVPIFRRTITCFLTHPQINSVFAVIASDARPHFAVAANGLAVNVVIGGATRTASVRAGLTALAVEAPDIVLIHDAARPFVSHQLISRLIDAASMDQGAAPGLAPTDALKTINTDGQVGGDVARDQLMQVQTPQVFPFAPLVQAYAQLPANAALADDIAVARSGRMPCTIIAGEVDNFKITHQDDLKRAERVLRPNGQKLCVTGTGFDVHRLIDGKSMTLCGVEIADGLALEGHSDADAALHALTDAMLGTIGAGDIGDHFPPTDRQWQNADSSLFLTAAHDMLIERGASLIHIDLTIICERPKIKPYREAMRARLATLLGLDMARVSVKATTTEKLGFPGRGEGLAALATASVQLLN